jgi:hypothetical protein
MSGYVVCLWNKHTRASCLYVPCGQWNSGSTQGVQSAAVGE